VTLLDHPPNTHTRLSDHQNDNQWGEGLKLQQQREVPERKIRGRQQGTNAKILPPRPIKKPTDRSGSTSEHNQTGAILFGLKSGSHLYTEASQEY
jgi:hypothetical protein